MNNLVSVEVLAKFFERDVRTVQLWANEGMPKEARGEYDFLKCVKWRIAKLEEENNILRNSMDEKLHALKVEGQKISNMNNSLKLRRLLGELISFEAAKIAWLNETTLLRKNILALIPKLTTALDNVNERSKRQLIIAELIYETLNMLGDFKPDLEIDENEMLDDDDKVDDNKDLNDENKL